MNISNIEQYVEQKNSWGKIFGNKPLSLMNAKDRQKIAASIDADLSPENLCMDGEASPAYVRQRHTFLSRCARELLSIDPSVKIFEFN